MKRHVYHQPLEFNRKTPEWMRSLFLYDARNNVLIHRRGAQSIHRGSPAGSLLRPHEDPAKRRYTIQTDQRTINASVVMWQLLSGSPVPTPTELLHHWDTPLPTMNKEKRNPNTPLYLRLYNKVPSDIRPHNIYLRTGLKRPLDRVSLIQWMVHYLKMKPTDWYPFCVIKPPQIKYFQEGKHHRPELGVMVETDLESDALRGPPAQFPHIRYDPRYDEWAAYIDPDRENPTTYFDNPGRAGVFYPNLTNKAERFKVRRYVHPTPHHPTPACLLGVDLDPDPDR